MKVQNIVLNADKHWIGVRKNERLYNIVDMHYYVDIINNN